MIQKERLDYKDYKAKLQIATAKLLKHAH
jgi:hypothetical protein